MNGLVVFVNVMTVLFAVVSTYLALKLVWVINRGHIAWGWWVILPIVLFYALVNRMLTLCVSIGIMNDPGGYIPAVMIFFWIGLALFLYGFYRVTVELIERCGDR